MSRTTRNDKTSAKNERARRAFERAMKHVESTLFMPETRREW